MQESRASTPYTENLDVYIAGSSAYWYFTFGGVNASAGLSQFESSPGLTSYNITAIDTSSWKSDFQIFGPNGYNLLPVPFVPPQGLFLTLGAASYPDALAAAAQLDTYFKSTFASFSNSSSSYVFYSPLSFDEIIPSTLLKLVPTSLGGFASAINSTTFEDSLSPIITLSGTKGPSGFYRELAVGSISQHALNSEGSPALLTYFGGNVTSLTRANDSSSSSVEVNVLDGVLKSPDNATVKDDMAQFEGSYAINVTGSEKLKSINATVLQQPPALLAVRNIDTGVLQTGQNMTVTISLTDLSNTTALDNVTFDDNWWSPSMFKLVRGNDTFSDPVLNSTEPQTPSYTLEYIGNTTGRVNIPVAPVEYSYIAGNYSFQSRAILNPISISLGLDDAAVYAYVTPVGGASRSVGTAQTLNLTVTNVGTRTATKVVADSRQIGSLLADGGTETISVSENSVGLVGTNVTRALPVSYVGTEGTQFNITTNTLSLDFSQSNMTVGYASITVEASIKPIKAGSTAENLTLSYYVANTGLGDISNLRAETTLPSGLPCGLTDGTGISCSAGVISLNFTSLTQGTTDSETMKVNVTTPTNFLLSPVMFNGTTSVMNFTGYSNALALPTGYVLTKEFSPTLLFPGVSSTVTLTALNNGPYTVYAANVSSTADPFDSLSASAVPSLQNASVSAHGNITKTYTVNASSVYGNQTASPVSSEIFFGATKFSLEGLGTYVSVYQPLSATITATPGTPTEGKSFDLNVTVSNPTDLNVTDVLFTFHLPGGLTLSSLKNASVSSDALTISTSSLLAHGDYSATAVAVQSSGTTITFGKAKLTFVYEGVSIHGSIKTKNITVKENVTSRYIIPIVIALLAMLGVAVYVRRMTNPTVPASQP